MTDETWTILKAAYLRCELNSTVFIRPIKAEHAIMLFLKISHGTKQYSRSVDFSSPQTQIKQLKNELIIRIRHKIRDYTEAFN